MQKVAPGRKTLFRRRLMSKTVDVAVTSKEAHDFLHLVFKIDRLWRKLASAATSGRISSENFLLIDQSWRKLIDEMQGFLNSLWKQFQNWQTGDIALPYYLLNTKEVSMLNKKVTALKKANGKVYQVLINSEFGEKFFSQCKSLDSCLVILQNTLRICDESSTINNIVKKHYFAILKKIVYQYKKDSEILESALKRKPRFVKKAKPDFMKKRETHNPA
jgi:flagellar biosynthesis regulator FlbT